MIAPVADAELRAELCRRHLREFIREAWDVVEPGREFVPGWHIDAISELLEAVTRGELRRLIINIPPRHMKSLQVAVFWPAWVWLSHPERRFLYASYAEALSHHHSAICRRLIMSEGRRGMATSDRGLLAAIGYRGLLRTLHGARAWRLLADQNVKHRFANDRAGERHSVSIGGAVTGEGGDICVLDDPHKPDEVESQAARARVLDWHDASWSTRINSEQAAQVLVMQRVHERDLTGHLLERAGYVHLCLPAQFEPGHPFSCDFDRRRRAGEPLWPAQWSARSLAERRRELGSFRHAGQYQQRPAPAEGGILKRAWWRYFDPRAPLPDFLELVQSWDFSFVGSDTADFVVGQVWGRFGARRYLLHQIHRRLSFTETVDAVHELTAWVVEALGAGAGHRKYFEDAANGPAIYDALADRVQGLIRVRPDGDKVARAHAVSPQLEAGNVYIAGRANAAGSNYDAAHTPAWAQGVIDECAAFPNAANDDRVDALSQALRKLQGTAERPYRQRGGGPTLTGGLLTREL